MPWQTGSRLRLACGLTRTPREAARFYAATFPDSRVLAVHKSPIDYPSGKAGDTLTVDFIVLGQQFLGLNGGPEFHFSEAVSFQVYTDTQEETDRYWNAIVGNGGAGEHVQLVQGQVRPELADRAACAGGRDQRSRPGGRQARHGSDDDDEEDRHRQDRGRAARLLCYSTVTLFAEVLRGLSTSVPRSTAT
jgi:predicted 3-demethylubiquinone-9 3-methyltransferase (glyoxalase superfamily)